jgi:hypothetical protein
LVDKLRQRRNSTGALARLDVIAVNDGDPGGIVAAIFQTPQAIE